MNAYLSLTAALAYELARQQTDDDGNLPVRSLPELADLIMPHAPGRLLPDLAAITAEWMVSDSAILAQDADGWSIRLRLEGS